MAKRYSKRRGARTHRRTKRGGAREIVGGGRRKRVVRTHSRTRRGGVPLPPLNDEERAELQNGEIPASYQKWFNDILAEQKAAAAAAAVGNTANDD